MPTVSERITANWADTEERLSKRPELGYDKAKGEKIADAIQLLWLDILPRAIAPATVDNLNVAVQQYVANEATIALIPLAKDAYMHGRISESKNIQEGGTVGYTNYNKLEALDALALELEKQNRKLRQRVERSLQETVQTSTIPTSVPVATRNEQAFFDPIARARGRG